MPAARGGGASPDVRGPVTPWSGSFGRPARPLRPRLGPGQSRSFLKPSTMRMPVNQAEALASPSCSGGAGCGLGSRAQPRRHGGLTPARTERRYRLACRSARSSAERAGPDRFAPAQAVAGPAVRGATPRAPAETPAPPSMVPVSLDAIRLPVKVRPRELGPGPVAGRSGSPRPRPHRLLLIVSQRDLEQLDERLRNVVGQRHPMLMAAADQIFGAGGKKMRPILCFLVARATQACAGNRCGRREGADGPPPSSWLPRSGGRSRARRGPGAGCAARAGPLSSGLRA